ncbi:YciI family protein [Cellulomonas edaphi]|uniref:YciI family protein n=1 Tax=Cellulomonas edaphi TaxID=3053468 RepID=A0ABT7SAJ7_9CELL|nr:YciI family protein [Cellulomons edaphi]MDM7832643.1 YciI family protein [Cellulomons edaphi]
MTTATYLVLLHGDEGQWQSRDAASLAALDASHQEFVAACARDGHEILAAHELDYARTARVVRRGAGRPPEVTDGPFTEAVEQLGGFYLVRTADVDALVALVADTLTEDAEIRPVVAGTQPR